MIEWFMSLPTEAQVFLYVLPLLIIFYKSVFGKLFKGDR
jgi:hypothetical protein